ncbi:MAG: hypothetical protein WCG04_02285 [Alphaproteobacteria bacterium]
MPRPLCGLAMTNEKQTPSPSLRAKRGNPEMSATSRDLIMT